MFFYKIKYFLKLFLINFTILYILLYLIELGINISNNKLFKKTRLYYLNTLQEKNPNDKIYLNFGVYKLLDKSNKILLLSGYENSKILLCLAFDKWIARANITKPDKILLDLNNPEGLAWITL